MRIVLELSHGRLDSRQDLWDTASMMGVKLLHFTMGPGKMINANIGMAEVLDEIVTLVREGLIDSVLFRFLDAAYAYSEVEMVHALALSEMVEMRGGAVLMEWPSATRATTTDGTTTTETSTMTTTSTTVSCGASTRRGSFPDCRGNSPTALPHSTSTGNSPERGATQRSYSLPDCWGEPPKPTNSSSPTDGMRTARKTRVTPANSQLLPAFSTEFYSVIDQWRARTNLELETVAHSADGAKVDIFSNLIGLNKDIHKYFDEPGPVELSEQATGLGWQRLVIAAVTRSLKAMVENGCGPGGWLRVGGATKRISSTTWETPTDGHISLNEISELGKKRTLRGKAVASYLHVDDGCFFSRADAYPTSDAAMEKVANTMEDAGFVVPDRNESYAIKKIIGYELSPDSRALQLPTRRASNLMMTMKWLLEVPTVDIELLRSVVGIWIWGCLLARHWLSLPGIIFEFMEVHKKRRARWWPSARKELTAMYRVVPYFKLDLTMKISPWVFAADAEGANNTDNGGWGIVSSYAGETLAEQIWAEDVQSGRTVARLDGDISRLARREREFEATVRVSKVPRAADALQWAPVLRGRWKEADHIMLGEGRTTNELLKILTSHSSSRRHIFACLEDNEPWAAATAKGRSCARGVNFLLRRRSALLAAGELQQLLPWIDTRRQPADSLSRVR